ncbi:MULTISPECIES: hypothetical protein [unclassified Chryseobacterium]|uniref:hypothetical protein n=1 Tax=unclassified Chryseobacterium TaxID=2593645 RepID=UPI00285337AF|nr:hypothetical protein [Chryseobacterium sp. CFS7]MDR4891890.1 hypothetical protein [Chryseobacterium sp. CFS7]
MKLTEPKITIDSEHSIEFGEAPWDSSVEVIRRRKDNSSGGYDPHSSSTIPINGGFLDIADLVNTCLDFDKIPPHDMHKIQAALHASATRLGITL